ncbi:fibronectin type III domain-containing protein [Nonomuraea sp. NPDC051941]|uniref:fibronectin type III domain-containing protein n=1 Tax=Nonomuraea sp. NPDC051941 TaxID=3364373 RepID=UPI0037C9F6A6
MANRIAATYGGGSATGTHTISFTAPTPGARLIVVVSSWNTVDAPSGWARDFGATGYNSVAIFSKIATGAERNVSFAHGDTRLHAVVYERDDCRELLFTRGATSASASVSTEAVTVSAGATGRVFGVVNDPNGATSVSNWNQGLARHYAKDDASSSSAFAHGAMPAAGSRVFTVSNIAAGSSSSVLALVGYGTTDAEPPTAPASLRATSVSGTAISVEWDASTDNEAVAGYGVYRDGVKIGADLTELHYTFTGLTAGTTYALAVDAVDSSGNRSARTQITVIAEVDVTPPSVPANLRLVEATFSSIAMAWDASTDNVGVAGYGFYLNGERQGSDQAELARTVTRLARGTAYTVQVDAADAAGNRSPRTLLVVETLAGADPSEPPGLTATPGPEQITLAWGASEPGGLPVVRYEVLLDGAVVAATTALGHVLEDLEAGSTYQVSVRAVDAGSARGPASTITVTVPPPSWTALASPTYRIGQWVGNVRDSAGVEWIVQDEEGWSAGAEAITLGADNDSSDGGFSGPGKYGARLVTLSGVALAPSRVQMLAAQERLTQAIGPAEAGVLRVAEAHMTRQARIRLENQVEITDLGSRAFGWTIVVKASDPRRYAVRGVYAEVEFAPAQTVGSTTITLSGDHPQIPARLRLIGPVADPVIRLEELGLEIRAKPGTTLPDARYELTIDLASRVVWSVVPPEIWPEPRPGRGLLGVFPARAALQRGPNTIRLSGSLVAGQEDRGPRLVIETTDAWI